MPWNVLLRALDDDAVRKIAEISGQNVSLCMQCGTCSGVCPMADFTDLLPRQAVLMLQHGIVEPLLDAKLPWLCASCHACQARCPRGLELPRVMEAVRQLMLRENKDRIDPRQINKDAIKEMPQIAMVAGFRKLTA